MIEITAGPEIERDGMRVGCWNADADGFPLFVEYEAGNEEIAEAAREDLRQAVATVLFLRRRAGEWGWTKVFQFFILPLVKKTDPNYYALLRAGVRAVRESQLGKES